MSDASDSDSDSDIQASESVQHATRAKFAFSHFCKRDSKHYCQVDTGRQRALDSTGEATSICNQSFATSKSTNLVKHLRSHALKSINDQLDRYDERIKHKLLKRREKESIDLPSKRVKEDVSNQPSLSSMLVKAGNSALKEELSEALALFLAMHDLPCRLAESPYLHLLLMKWTRAFKAGAITKLDHRRKVAKEQSALASSLAVMVDRSLKESKVPITLVFDGWSNITGVHVQNILALCSSAAFFLKSDISVTGRSTAVVLGGMLKTVMNNLISKGVVVAGIVADNASVNGAISSQLKAQYPWLLPLPCAAHTLQLCVVRFLDEDSVAETLKTYTTEIYVAIKKSQPNLAEFRRVQGEKALNLKKPQRTRWSSSFIAFQRLLRVQGAVMFTLTEAKHCLVDKLNSAFWADLKLVMEFLKPFKASTDIIQSDRAGLLDVYLQFRMLTAHVRNAPECLSHAAHIMQKAIANHWSKHINQQAVYMCAKFAEENVANSMFSDHVKLTAPDWFIDWSAKLWQHARSLQKAGVDSRSEQEKEDELEEFRLKINKEYDKYLAGSWPYQSITDKIIAARPALSRVEQNWAPFDVISPWRRLQEVSTAAPFVFGVIAILSLNCSEAAAERSFSQQKLTHSLQSNRKNPKTVEEQMYIKWNERALHNRHTFVHTASRLVNESKELDEDSEFDDDFNASSDTDVGLDTDSQQSDDSGKDGGSDTEQVELRTPHRSVKPPSSAIQRAPAHPSLAAARPPFARRVARARAAQAPEQLAPAQRRWTMVDRISPSLDDFCKRYIQAKQLRLPSPFKRGAAMLRAAMEADSTVSKEQPREAQKHIMFLLEEASKLEFEAEHSLESEAVDVEHSIESQAADRSAEAAA